jgi:hypothetical protein
VQHEEKSPTKHVAISEPYTNSMRAKSAIPKRLDKMKQDESIDQQLETIRLKLEHANTRKLMAH